MGVVREIFAVRKDLKTCLDLAKAFVQVVDHTCSGYKQGYIIQDNYAVENSLKEKTRVKRSKHAKVHGCKIVDSTPINDSTMFLASTETKDALTFYLADHLIKSCKSSVVTVNRKSVQFNKEPPYSMEGSNQEEADTLIMLYASELRLKEPNCRIHIYSQDTDVLVLALYHLHSLGPNIFSSSKELPLYYDIYQELSLTRNRCLNNDRNMLNVKILNCMKTVIIF